MSDTQHSVSKTMNIYNKDERLEYPSYKKTQYVYISMNIEHITCGCFGRSKNNNNNF